MRQGTGVHLAVRDKPLQGGADNLEELLGAQGAEVRGVIAGAGAGAGARAGAGAGGSGGGSSSSGAGTGARLGAITTGGGGGALGRLTASGGSDGDAVGGGAGSLCIRLVSILRSRRSSGSGSLSDGGRSLGGLGTRLTSGVG